MLAMFRKDFYCTWKFSVLAMAVCVWVSLAAHNLVGEIGTGLFILAIYSLFLPVNAIALDEKYRWSRFAAILPVQPWKIVLEKYLLAWAQTAFVFGLSGTICWIRSAESLTARDLVHFGMTAFTAMLLFQAYALPMVYRFGKQTAMNAVIYPLGMGLTLLLLNLRGRAMTDLSRIFGPPVLLLAVAVNLGSFLLSVRFYTRRQRGWYD